VPLHKAGGFGEGCFTSSEGVLLRSDNILMEKDAARIRWETLAEGDVGIPTPDKCPTKSRFVGRCIDISGKGETGLLRRWWRISFMFHYKHSSQMCEACRAEEKRVTFARSGVAAVWNGEHPSLLVLAEQYRLQLSYLCRLGQCGQCESVVLSGAVSYAEEPVAQPRFGGEFLCQARPVGDIVLDV
jgi:ferredoxin